jgi:ABC-2 type transport system permease protein
MTALAHTGYLTGRWLRTFTRLSVFMVISLIQPMIWLLLFGSLFSSLVRLPGFGSGVGNFVQFITPGVVMMTALFGGAWAGIVQVQDMERGVMDRMLASPVSRGAVIGGNLAYYALVGIVQTLIIVAIALAAGARFPGGVAGVAITVLAGMLLMVVVAALSNAVALLTRQQESLIGISQLMTLPLTFLSSAVMDLRLAPEWVAHVAWYNPMQWAVVSARQALQAETDWAAVWSHLGVLAGLALVMGAVATQAFRAYRRST